MTDPAGFISNGLERGRKSVAASTTFQTWVGHAGEPDDAIDHVHRYNITAISGGGVYTKAELEALRPYCLIMISPEDGPDRNRVTESQREDTGIIRVAFDWDVPALLASDEPEAFLQFMNAIGVILEEMQDLRTSNPNGDYLVMDKVKLLEYGRSTKEQRTQEGDFLRAICDLYWS